jgi:hypothetical protein
LLIRIDTSGLRRTSAHEYLLRFAFGGAVTVFAGLIAKSFGPSMGGLFLAVPAIFPAAATLAEKHERQRFRSKGLKGEARAVHASGAESAGAAIGSIGLLGFAVMFSLSVPRLGSLVALLLSTAVWAVISATGWWTRKRLC